MKTAHLVSVLLNVQVMTFVMSGCGESKDGEQKEDQSGATSAGTPSSSGSTVSSSESDFVPTLSFTIPSSNAALNLLETEVANTVLERRVDRINKVILKLNNIIDRLNSDAIHADGGFSGRGPDGLMSGKIGSIDDGVYNYEATLCHDGGVFMHLKWSLDGTKITAMRDFNITPLGDNDATDMLIEVDYAQAEATTMDMYVHGRPWATPDLVSEEDRLTEFSRGEIDSNGVVTLKGVADRYADIPLDTTFAGDEYLTGKIAADGGEFLGYRQADGVNCGDFDETAISAPGWCLGRTIDSTTRFDEQERGDAWRRLESVGIASKGALKAVTMPEGLSCE